MGCCSSVSELNPQALHYKIRKSMESGTVFNLDYYIRICAKLQNESFNIDRFIIKDQENNNITFLALAFLYGRLDVVRWLEEKYNASFREMEKYLLKHETSGLQILAENGHTKLFEYYAPIYFTFKHELLDLSRHTPKDTMTLDLSEISKDFLRLHPEAKLTPIQYACINGHYSIMQLCISYNQNHNPVQEFDINTIEQKYGFNCALLSCKLCNFNMIKFLHTKCQADFHHLNNNKESSIQILISESNRAGKPEYFNCLLYLIESIKVDVTYNYEETLILLEENPAFDYILGKLREKGLSLPKDFVKEHIWKAGKVRKNLGIAEYLERPLTDMLQELKNDEISSITFSNSSN